MNDAQRIRSEQSESIGKVDRIIAWYEREDRNRNWIIRSVFRACVIAWFCWKQLRRHRAEGMAAELTYRTVFSLIPVLVLGLVMFRVFGGLDDFQTRVESQLYDFFGVPDVLPSAYLEGEAQQDFATETDELDTDPLINDETTAEQLEADGINDIEIVSGSPAAPQSNLTDAQANGASAGPAPIAAPTDEAIQPDVTATDAVDGPKDPASEASASEDSLSNDVALKNVVPEDAERTSVAPTSSTENTRNSIRRRMQEVTRFVSAIDFRSIGVLGLLLFVYAAVALANTAEQLFNRIFDVVSHRPFHLRVAIHWSMITLGSGLLAMSLTMSSEVVEWSGSVGVNSGLRQYLRQFLSFSASWVLLFLLYSLMPYTKVSIRAAATGSLVSALFWELGKYGFQIYVVKAVPYSAIYGSIGLLPLFLLWIYLTWWIVLFGLIVTQTLQTVGGQSLQGLLVTGRERKDFSPEWLLPALVEIASAFSRGKSLTVHQLARTLTITTVEAARAGDVLVDAKLANYVDSPQKQLTLARPAESIRVSEVLKLTNQLTRARTHAAWKKILIEEGTPSSGGSEKTLAALIETLA